MKFSTLSKIILVISVLIIVFFSIWLAGNPQPPAKQNADTSKAPLRLVFVGDVMLSRNIGNIISNKGPEYPFEYVHGILRQGDITMGNLESPISDREDTVCRKNATVCFKASPETIRGLTYAGFDIMTVANNHALDHGPFVMNDTLSHLSRAGIQYVGVQQGMNDSIQNAVIVHDPRMTIAFLGFEDINNVSTYSASDYPRPWKASDDAVIPAVTRAQSQADVVVVTFHFGNEYNFTHSGRQEQLSHAAADAGADIIIGHHPHVIQDIEVYNTSIIAYSLGNFIFDMGGKGVREGAVLTVEIDPTTKRIRGHSIEKVSSNAKFQPRPGVMGIIFSYYDRGLAKLFAIV